MYLPKDLYICYYLYLSIYLSKYLFVKHDDEYCNVLKLVSRSLTKIMMRFVNNFANILSAKRQVFAHISRDVL